MITGIRHTGIVVRDLNAAVGFYTVILGLSVVRQGIESGPYLDAMLGLEGAEVAVVKMQAADGGTIELLAFLSHLREPRPRDICDCGITHLAFTVDDADKMHKRLMAYGVKCVSEPQLTEGGFRVFFCNDPEGNKIEFVQVMH